MTLLCSKKGVGDRLLDAMRQSDHLQQQLSAHWGPRGCNITEIAVESQHI